MKASKNILRTE